MLKYFNANNGSVKHFVTLVKTDYVDGGMTLYPSFGL